MSEKREIKVGDELVYITRGMDRELCITTNAIAKKRKYDYATEHGSKVRTNFYGFYDIDKRTGVESVTVGEAPASYTAYLKTEPVVKWLEMRLELLKKRDFIRRFTEGSRNLDKVKNGHIIEIYEILKQYE